MQPSKSLALAAFLALAAVTGPAAAAVAAPAEPVVLEAVVVTPAARYTATEWQARQAARSVQAAVMLERVIVTPSGHYTVAQWQQRQQGLLPARHASQGSRVKVWLKTVWKHFNFQRLPVEA